MLGGCSVGWFSHHNPARLESDLIWAVGDEDSPPKKEAKS